MPFFENVGGTWKQIQLYENVGGVWKAIQLYENVGGTWSLIGSQLGVSASDVTGSASAFATSALVTSGTPNTTPSGGISPFTYSWSYQSGDAVIACSGSTSQNPTWSKTISAGPQVTTTTSAVWKVTVTDAVGSTASTTINITLSFTNETG